MWQIRFVTKNLLLMYRKNISYRCVKSIKGFPQLKTKLVFSRFAVRLVCYTIFLNYVKFSITPAIILYMDSLKLLVLHFSNNYTKITQFCQYFYGASDAKIEHFYAKPKTCKLKHRWYNLIIKINHRTNKTSSVQKEYMIWTQFFCLQFPSRLQL